ncbi:MAG TPA: RHS repeat-associated core domain-containing protein [Pyrinomonadaceae bacterium]|nr:RHS repeat-associated core domain-containing protein [Pyrinomonadaceae bacterium]
MSHAGARPSSARSLVAQLLALTLLCQSVSVPARAAARSPNEPGGYNWPAVTAVTVGMPTEPGGAQPAGPGATGAPPQDASCPAATSRPAASRLVYTGQVSASCGEPLPVSARLTDECGGALAGRRLDFKVGALSASATTDASGVASTSLVPPPSAAALPLTVEFAGDDGYSPARDASSVRVARTDTSLRYTGEAVLAAGTAAPVSAVLTDALTGRPVPNATLRFEVGSAAVSATTDASGVAAATVSLPPAETFDRSPLRITFAGDECRGPASAAAEVTAYLRTSFVIWGGNNERLRLGQRVNFWGHSWAKQVAQGDYKAHSDFKGYADTVRQFSLCQVNVRTTSQPPLDNSCWSTKPGQSFPPETIPEYIGVIISTSADKSGAPDFGNIAALAVVKVDPAPAYGAVPGKPGFGRLVAVIADGEGVFPAPPALAAAQTQAPSALPSQTLSVALNVSNTSASAASDVSVTETFTNAAPPSASADLGTLAPSAARTQSFGVTVPALQPRREGESSQDYQKRLGAAEGTVYASLGRVGFRDASGRAMPAVAVSSQSRLQIPRLFVGVSAAACVSPGATLPYVVTLTNAGGAAAASAAAVVTFPDGTTTRVETNNLEPGKVFTATVNWSVPPVAPKGAGESDAEYVSRLRSFDGKVLKAAASLTWKDALGNDYGAVEQECASVERVPVLSQSAQAPAPMLPGQRVTLPSGVRNVGSAGALAARLRATNPDATVFDAPPFALAPGSSSDVPVTLTAPPVAPKGPDETDAAYLARLQSNDNRPIDFALALEWADAAGNSYGPVAAALRTTEVLPIILLTLSAPETVEAGETVAYRVEAANVGHAEATGLGVSVTLPGGVVQPVTLPTPALAPGDKQAAVVSFSVPPAQPEGQITAQAAATWKDAVANGYGPVSAAAVTNVLNPNRPPLVDAGPDQTIVLPSPAALQGTASDDGKPFGSTLTLLWTKVSGPGEVTFAVPAQAVTTAAFSAEGVYVLRLTASDSVLTASDETTVNVTLPPDDPVYHEDGDLTGGDGVNVVSDEFNHLHISNETTPFNFIWVAVSSKGTVVKIDTDTGQVLGEYWSSPAGQPKNPSRTTVDLNGNVWASNRNGNSVLRIGLAENGQCVDRNGNGVIDTSRGFGDIRPWTNAGGVDTDGGVETAQDECVINYTRVRSSGTRHVSVNSLNDVWVSGTGGQRFDLLDGATGQIKRQEPSVGYGGYGGLIDERGVIWSARPLLRWDTALPLKGVNGGNWKGWGHDSYGLCLDGQGNVWNTALDGNLIYKFAPDGALLGTYKHGSHWAQGCVVDKNDHVWVAHSLHANSVGRLKPDGTWIGNVPVGSGPTGVAVDAKGKIWATNHNSRNVSRIDPEAGPMGADGETRVGQVDLTTIDLKGNLYNYSDMTGSTLSGAPPSGTWTQVFDSGIDAAGWGVIGWTGRVCGDASLRVRASSSTDGRNFSPPAEVSNGAPFSVPAGRYLKVSVTFKRASSGESPFLYDLTVGTKGYQLAAADNPPPAVDAGPDQTATMPNPANLAGSACDAGRVSGLSVSWEKVSGPGEVIFANARVPATTAAFSEEGEYTLRLAAGDAGRTASDVLTVVVRPFNDPPAVNAGADQAVILPAAATLAGTVTDDALPKNSSVAVSWSKLSGPGEVTFANSTSAATTATFAEPGDYVLRLTGDDSQLANVDDMTVKVYPPNNAPAVNAGQDLTVRLPDKAALNSTVTDDGLPLGKTVTFAWGKVSGPGTVSFANAKAADTTAAFGAPGTYVLRLTASDTQLSASDELTVTVNPANQPPTVSAGADLVVTLPDKATLAGAAADEDELPEGRVVTTTWSKVSGPGTVTFSDPTSAATTASFSEAGAYVLRLTASDSALNRADDVAVTVNPSPVNLAPNVNAGPDQSVTLPAKATLAGAASDDRQPAGSTLSLAWSKASGPGNVTFANASAAATTAAFSAAGEYVLRLTASDSALTSSDEIAVTVLPVNQPPAVKAGADLLINFPASATLNGTAADDGQPPGSRLTVSWSKVSGPGEVSFADAAAAATTATFSAGGRYVLRLTATDSALSRSDDVAVTVNEAPTAEAGPDQSVHLPKAAALVGAVTDDALPPGKVIALSWSKVSGPGTVTFSRPAAASTTAAFTEVGTYVLRLTANDSLLQASDELTVNVLPPLPPPPSVTITSPADGTEITSPVAVTGTVSNGTWRLEYSLGPDPASPDSGPWTTIASGDTPVAGGVLGTFDPTLLLNGTYALRLTATDVGGQATAFTRTFVAAGRQKVGNFTISFEDLDVPVAGLPVQLLRTYDSRDKRVGDFGVGWTLSIRNVRLEKSVELGRHWRGIITPGTLPQYCLQPSRPNIVTITFPDDRVYKFQATTAKQCQAIYPIEFARFGFTPMPGTRGTLVPEAPVDILVDGGFPGPVELLDASDPQLRTYDPTVFRFTDENGTVYVIDQKAGVRSVADPNGNRLTINRDGITHSSGQRVAFTRDSAGRITRITDPSGNPMSYDYDAAGDLTAFRDRENNESKYSYDGDHYLLSYVDPRGVRPVRYDYDDAGRLTRLTDAFGKVVELTHDLGGRREVLADRLGRAVVNEYDERGRLSRTTDAAGGVTSRTFDARDNLLSETNAEGRTTSFTYDANGNKLTETDPRGQTTRFTYNSRGQLLTTTDPLGRVTAKTYDARGNLLSVRSPLGEETRYAYGPGGTLASITDALGNTTRYEYAGGHLTKETDALGRVTTYTRDANGNPRTQTVFRADAAGSAEPLTTSYEYDRLGRLVRTVHLDGATTGAEYSPAGWRSATVDPLGRRTTYEHDEMGRLVRTVYPDGTSEEAGYDAEGRRTRAVDRAGRATTYAHDAAGRPLRTTYPDGASTSTAYDRLGRPVALTDERGNTTRYEYDPDCACGSRRVKVIDALGHVTKFTHDAAGNEVSRADAKGNVTRFEYDANNRLARVVFPDGGEERFARDALGRVVAKTDRAGKTTRFEYDRVGDLVRVVDAAGQATAYAYAAAGQLVSQTDANGHATTFEYDRMGRRTRRTLPLGMSETYGYDLAGRLTARTDFDGKTTAYAYDVMGRLVSKTPDPSLGEPPVTFTYTPAGRRRTMADATGVTTYSYDGRDRLLSKATPHGTLTYSYDAAGNLLTARSSNAGGTSVAYSYDPLNRLATVSDDRLAAEPTSYSYDANGNLESVAYPNGVTTRYSYDPLNRLTSLTAAGPSSTLAGYAYTLGAAGNRLSVTEHGGRTVAYAYDDLYRLTGEAVRDPTGGGDGAAAYAYDRVGNRLSRTSTLPGLADASYEYDANDRLASDTHDRNGNTLASQGKTYSYDSENRLTSIGGGAVTYLYDGDGNRVSKTAGGVTTNYLVDTNNPTGYAQVVEELRGGSVTRAYTYGHDLIAQRQLIGGEWRVSFYGYDGQGTVRFLTDPAGAVTDTYTYDAFGNLLGRTGDTPNDYLYAGEQYDANSGFYYLRARYLNPSSGRFLTMDSFEGIPWDPPSLHKYLYTSGNPVNSADPSGRFDRVLAVRVLIMVVILAVMAVVGHFLFRTVEDTAGGLNLTATLPGDPVLDARIIEAIAFVNGLNSPSASAGCRSLFSTAKYTKGVVHFKLSGSLRRCVNAQTTKVLGVGLFLNEGEVLINKDRPRDFTKATIVHELMHATRAIGTDSILPVDIGGRLYRSGQINGYIIGQCPELGPDAPSDPNCP